MSLGNEVKRAVLSESQMVGRSECQAESALNPGGSIKKKNKNIGPEVLGASLEKGLSSKGESKVKRPEGRGPRSKKTCGKNC